MNHSSHDELISAYLDDELSTQERSQFEEKIDQDPKLRETIEELPALKTDMQSLPKHQLENDFANRVLVKAKEESGKLAQKKDSQSKQTHKTTLASSTNAEDRHAGRIRGIAFSAITITAALAIMVFYSNPNWFNSSSVETPTNPAVTINDPNKKVPSIHTDENNKDKERTLAYKREYRYLPIRSKEELAALFGKDDAESGEALSEKLDRYASASLKLVQSPTKSTLNSQYQHQPGSTETLFVLLDVPSEKIADYKFARLLKDQDIMLQGDSLDSASEEPVANSAANTKQPGQKNWSSDSDGKKPAPADIATKANPVQTNENKTSTAHTHRAGGIASGGRNNRNKQKEQPKFRIFALDTTMEQLVKTMKSIKKQPRIYKNVKLSNTTKLSAEIAMNRAAVNKRNRNIEPAQFDGYRGRKKGKKSAAYSENEKRRSVHSLDKSKTEPADKAVDVELNTIKPTAKPAKKAEKRSGGDKDFKSRKKEATADPKGAGPELSKKPTATNSENQKTEDRGAKDADKFSPKSESKEKTPNAKITPKADAKAELEEEDKLLEDNDIKNHLRKKNTAKGKNGKSTDLHDQSKNTTTTLDDTFNPKITLGANSTSAAWRIPIEEFLGLRPPSVVSRRGKKESERKYFKKDDKKNINSDEKNENDLEMQETDNLKEKESKSAKLKNKIRSSQRFKQETPKQPESGKPTDSFDAKPKSQNSPTKKGIEANNSSKPDSRPSSRAIKGLELEKAVDHIAGDEGDDDPRSRVKQKAKAQRRVKVIFVFRVVDKAPTTKEKRTQKEKK